MDLPRFDVRLFGAKGDGSTNDQAAIQNAITAAALYDAQYDNPANAWGGSVYFPPGIYKVNSTINWNGGATGRAGVNLVGAGALPGDPFGADAADWAGPASQIRWGGSAGGTMILAENVQGATIEGLTLVGQNSSEGNRAGTLLKAQVNSTGGGCRLLTFRNLSLVRAATGLSLGLNVTNATQNESLMIYERLAMILCDLGMEALTSTGVGHRFNMLLARNCPKVIDMRRGGGLNIDTAQLDSCGSTGESDTAWAITLGLDGASPAASGGRDVAVNRITNLRFSDSGRILNVYGDYRVALDGFHEAQDALAYDVPLVYAKGCALTFSQSRFQSSPVVKWADRTSWYTTVRFRDCRFAGNSGSWPGSAIFDPAVSGNLKYLFEWCEFDDDGIAPDVDNNAW